MITFSSDEINMVNKFYNINNIRDLNSIDLLITNIKSRTIESPVNNSEIKFDTYFEIKYGSCFNRSLLIQKIFKHNNIEFYPCYIFYKPVGSTSYLDFFSKSLNSHQAIVFKFDKKSYIIEVNNFNNGIKTRNIYFSWNDYKLNSTLQKYDIKIIPHLNNRNGTFIYPSFIPDFY